MRIAKASGNGYAMAMRTAEHTRLTLIGTNGMIVVLTSQIDCIGGHIINASRDFAPKQRNLSPCATPGQTPSYTRRNRTKRLRSGKYSLRRRRRAVTPRLTSPGLTPPYGETLTMLEKLTHHNRHIQRFYEQLAALCADMPQQEIAATLSIHIANWERREENLYVWASTGGAAAKHPLGGLVDAFDVATLLLDLRRARGALHAEALP